MRENNHNILRLPVRLRLVTSDETARLAERTQQARTYKPSRGFLMDEPPLTRATDDRYAPRPSPAHTEK